MIKYDPTTHPYEDPFRHVEEAKISENRYVQSDNDYWKKGLKLMEINKNEFLQGFHAGMCEAARTLREAANDHKQIAENSKKILDGQANEMAAAILYGWANGLEINAQKALK